MYKKAMKYPGTRNQICLYVFLGLLTTLCGPANAQGIADLPPAPAFLIKEAGGDVVAYFSSSGDFGLLGHIVPLADEDDRDR